MEERPGIWRFSNLRFRTRLALILFLTMATTSAILIVTYVRVSRRMRTYVNGVAEDLTVISQVAKVTDKIAPQMTEKQVLDMYTRVVETNGLTRLPGSTISVVTPSGKIIGSTNRKQVGKKTKIRKRHIVAKPDLVKMFYNFKDVNTDSGVQEDSYTVQFPLTKGDKVIGYLTFKGIGDDAKTLLRRNYVIASFWIFPTMLAGIFGAVYLAFRFTRPVDMLVEGAKQVAQGNMYVSLPVTEHDEIGRLEQTFNQMVERLRESRTLQERLNEAEKLSLVGRFAATAAHEIRNSLNFINLSIDQVRIKQASLAAGREGTASSRTSGEIQRNLANVKDEISRLNRLVNDFLSIGRQTSPILAPCDLRQTLADAVAMVDKQAHTQEVEIELDVPEGLPVIDADSSQLKTCFLNILTNSVQAMPRGGSIRVSTHETLEKIGTGKIRMCFSDTGPGVPAENREKIFAPYFSTKTTGFGLGLAITRKIVEDHGGRIYVAATPGPGAEFVIEIPMSHAPVQSAEMVTA
ncbi:MAG TPA: ATP-binding protein [Terriglobia bacterium]|nr:ATP-binding protein [Terriglobia bacterium]